MDVANIFCQSLDVTSLAKTFLTVYRFRTDLVSVWTAWGIRSKMIVIRSNGFGYLYAFVVYEPVERNVIFLACRKQKTWKIIFFNWLHFFFSQICKFRRTKFDTHTVLSRHEVLISLIILLQVMLSSWCSTRKGQLCFLRNLAIHLQNCRIQ